MWSNDDVADDDPNEASPWARDDWVPESSVPEHSASGAGEPSRSSSPPPGIFGEPPPDDFADPDPAAVPSRSTLGRRLVAGAIILALLIGSAGALLRSGGSSDDPVPATTPLTSTVDDRPPVTLEALQPSPSSPPSSPSSPSSSSSSAGLAAAAPSTVGPDGDVRMVAPFEDGEPPRWTAAAIAVPENLSGIEPTEVVTLSQSNVLAVTEFPSGRTRSLDMSALGSPLQLAVGGDALAVFSSTELVQIRESEPVVRTAVGDGVIFVQPWIGTGRFIVTTPDTGTRAPQQDLLLAADGSLELLEHPVVDESAFFSRSFSPRGDALVNAAGGVYAIDVAGDSRRISTGTLLATGTRHWAIEECDEELRCATSVVEWDSGTVTPGVLDPLESFGVIDPATTISPDGRSIVYRADSDGSGRRRILDVASGTSVEAGRINQFVYPDSWAADSSGLFVGGDSLQFVDRTTGEVTRIGALAGIRTVATRAPG
jgi:hypothetical protein